MQWLVRLYDQALVWAHHAHAPRYLFAVSFVEASVFPIPPYFMLAPMALAKPHKALNYALLATIASVCGGILGYVLGCLLFKPLAWPLITYFGYTAAYQNVIQIFQEHGYLALLLLGMSPIPYKFIAIGAGMLMLPIPAFVAVSLLSRGLKFFAVALVMRWGGVNMQQYLRLAVQKFGLVGLGIFGLAVYIYLR